MEITITDWHSEPTEKILVEEPKYNWYFWELIEEQNVNPYEYIDAVDILIYSLTR